MVIVKTKYLFFSIVFAAFLSSSMPLGSHSLEIGKEAPSLTLSSGNRHDNLPELGGNYVIINFWSFDDPISRINNSRLSDVISTIPSSKVKFISICMDDNKTLRDEIMSADNVSANTISLSINDLSPQVAEDFQTNSGNRSFIIDPFGNLASICPSAESIPGIIS